MTLSQLLAPLALIFGAGLADAEPITANTTVSTGAVAVHLLGDDDECSPKDDKWKNWNKDWKNGKKGDCNPFDKEADDDKDKDGKCDNKSDKDDDDGKCDKDKDDKDKKDKDKKDKCKKDKKDKCDKDKDKDKDDDKDGKCGCKYKVKTSSYGCGCEGAVLSVSLNKSSCCLNVKITANQPVVEGYYFVGNSLLSDPVEVPVPPFFEGCRFMIDYLTRYDIPTGSTGCIPLPAYPSLVGQSFELQGLGALAPLNSTQNPDLTQQFLVLTQAVHVSFE